jgi:glycosyltransferase involved in cell wall biosynthesis
MRFTVVTPVFNGMPWLPECMASVDAQREDVEVEHIVLDPGSTDGSREWLEENAPEGTRLVFEPDDGQTDALLRGFRDATGDVLGWMNADDFFLPRALLEVRRLLEAAPEAAAITGRCRLVGPAGEPRGLIPVVEDTSLRGLLETPTNIPQPATLFRRSAYEASGGLDVSLDLAMDVDLWLKIAAVGPILRSEVELASFRLHPDAKTALPWAATREDLRVRLRHGLSPLSPAARRMFRVGYLRPTRVALSDAWHKNRGPTPAVSTADAHDPASESDVDVSVVIPLHDSAATIEETLDSLASQEGVAVEAIVVDDRSRDDGLARCRSHRVGPVVLATPTPGPSAARNRGFSVSRGRYVVFLDADDLLLPGALRRRVAEADARGGESVVVTAYDDLVEGVRRKGTIRPELSDDAARALLQANRLVMHGAITPRARLAALGSPFDEELWHGEDWALWLKLACLGVPFHVVDEVDCLYRRRPMSLSTDLDRALDDTIRMMRRARAWIDSGTARGAGLERLRRRELHDYLRHRARRRVGERHLARGAGDLAEALLADPKAAMGWPAKVWRRVS